MLISSLIHILDRNQIQGKGYSDKGRPLAHAISAAAMADTQDTFVTGRDGKEETPAIEPAKPLQAERIDSSGRSSRRLFDDFLRTVDEVTARPPAPGFDIFQ